MTALAADSALVVERASGFSTMTGDFGSGVVDDSATFYKGAIVVYDPSDQKIKPGATATGLIALGRYDGPQSAAGVNVRSGIYSFVNGTAADEIDNADAGANCYIVDDATVAIVSTGRSVAGVIKGVTADGRVEVAINPYS